jgi:hypothetical protein
MEGYGISVIFCRDHPQVAAFLGTLFLGVLTGAPGGFQPVLGIRRIEKILTTFARDFVYNFIIPE